MSDRTYAVTRFCADHPFVKSVDWFEGGKTKRVETAAVDDGLAPDATADGLVAIKAHLAGHLTEAELGDLLSKLRGTS